MGSYVRISSLSQDEITHLRRTGLIRRCIDDPTPPPNDNDNDSDEDDNEDNGDDKSDKNTDDNTTVDDPSQYNIHLLRNKHSAFLTRPLHPSDIFPLSRSYVSLDSSKPWILYWTLHSLDLLSAIPPDEDKLLGIAHTIESCWTDAPPLRRGDGGGDVTRASPRALRESWSESIMSTKRYYKPGEGSLIQAGFDEHAFGRPNEQLSNCIYNRKP